MKVYNLLDISKELDLGVNYFLSKAVDGEPKLCVSVPAGRVVCSFSSLYLDDSNIPMRGYRFRSAHSDAEHFTRFCDLNDYSKVLEKEYIPKSLGYLVLSQTDCEKLYRRREVSQYSFGQAITINEKSGKCIFSFANPFDINNPTSIFPDISSENFYHDQILSNKYSWEFIVSKNSEGNGNLIDSAEEHMYSLKDVYVLLNESELMRYKEIKHNNKYLRQNCYKGSEAIFLKKLPPLLDGTSEKLITLRNVYEDEWMSEKINGSWEKDELKEKKKAVKNKYAERFRINYPGLGEKLGKHILGAGESIIRPELVDLDTHSDWVNYSKNISRKFRILMAASDYFWANQFKSDDKINYKNQDVERELNERLYLRKEYPEIAKFDEVKFNDKEAEFGASIIRPSWAPQGRSKQFDMSKYRKPVVD